MRLARSFAAITASLSLTALCLPTSANAERWHSGYGYHGHHYHQYGAGTAFFGLAAGLILGGALASSYYGPGYSYGDTYYYPRPYIYSPPVVYAPAPYYGYGRPYYYNGYYSGELEYGD
jgi:hypothetical protein